MHGQYLFCFTVAWGKAVNDVNKVGENAISMVFFYLCHTVKRPCINLQQNAKVNLH